MQSTLLARLMNGERIAEAVAVVAAHPDDETVGIGSRMRLFDAPTLIHATDGAPLDMVRARHLGFESAKAYSSARYSELAQALDILNVQPATRICLGYSDGELAYHLVELTKRLQPLLEMVSGVFTHAFEGGHPDHDACAFAVQCAVQRLLGVGRAAPARFEFTGYHSVAQKFHVGAFWPEQQYPAVTVQLSRDEVTRKGEALRAFETQAWIAQIFNYEHESYRPAPTYDFLRPTPPREWLYDANKSWKLKSEDWMTCSALALRDLDITLDPKD
jgi:LmbE family N-acetylglucosaminyl deacetylase